MVITHNECVRLNNPKLAPEINPLLHIHFIRENVNIDKPKLTQRV